MVGANRSRRVHIPRAAHGSDLSPERFGNLDRKCTYATRRAINQNLVAWLDASLITKTLKGSECRDWHGCCVLKRTVGWLQSHVILLSAHILGKGPSARAEDRVAWFELGYVLADRFHSPCDIVAGDLALWCEQPAAD
jgi:hypothetical protein